MRGAEGPAFFSKKIPEKWAVTLRIGTAAGAIRRNAPPLGGEGRKNQRKRGQKSEIHHQAENETGKANRLRRPKAYVPTRPRRRAALGGAGKRAGGT